MITGLDDFVGEGRTQPVPMSELEEFKRKNGYGEPVIFRGVKTTTAGAAFTDPAYNSTRRRSAYTHNYYTLWMNGHEDWAEFPKRELICTNDITYANLYKAGNVSTGSIYGVYPNDKETLFGVAPTGDIWDAFYFVVQSDGRTKIRSVHDVEAPAVFADSVEFTARYGRDIGNGARKFVSSNYTNILNSIGCPDDNLKKMVTFLKKNKAYDFTRQLFSPEAFLLLTYDMIVKQLRPTDSREIWTDKACYLENVEI